MKSNEEFIAGIYEKAANYTEKEEKKEKFIYKASVLRIAAMVVICVGLAGIGILTLSERTDDSTNPSEENPGAVSLSQFSEENNGNSATIQYRMLPTEESALFTGTVESVDTEETIIWIQLEFEGEVPEEQKKESLIAVQWNVTKEIPAEIAAGMKLKVAGTVGTYNNTKSERFGSTQLTVTDAAMLWIWIEEENSYRNYSSEENK
ncbi:MAG: hypothetical protein ACI4FZ_06435 [Lachnospiraceae bacterium]